MRKTIMGLIFLFCCGSSCEKNPFAESVLRMWVENRSNKAVSFLVSRQYPDTAIPDAYSSLRGAAPDAKNPYDFYEKSWSEVFNNLPADTLSVFVFSSDTLVKYPWQQIRSEYKILKRYDLSLSDLKNRSYTIVYP